MNEWFTCDGNDQAFQVISDDEIVGSISQANEYAENDAFKWFEKQCYIVRILQLKRIIVAMKRKKLITSINNDQIFWSQLNYSDWFYVSFLKVIFHD